MSAADSILKLADFEQVVAWDHSVRKSVVRPSTLSNSGKPQVGTTYDVTVDFVGSDVDIEYVIRSLSVNAVTLVGTSDKSVTTDCIVCTDSPTGGCTLTYDANISIAFPFWLFDCCIKCMFQATVDEAIEGLGRFLSVDSGITGTTAAATGV
jgi:hypothetical protein